MKTRSGQMSIVYGAVDCVVGFLSIAFQATVTYYCANLNPQAYGWLRPSDVLLDLGLASAGIWIGILFLLTGIFGISSGLRRRKPAFGTKPARDSYGKLVYGLFVTSVLSAIFSTVLIAISAALSAEWLLYLYDPPLMHPYLREVATTIGSLGLVLLLIGLIALPINCIVAYLSWINVKSSRTVGRVVFSTGPPLSVVSRVPQYNHPQSSSPPNRTIEVVTRPASQMNLPPKSYSAPYLQPQPQPRHHELSRNPSFHSALGNNPPSHNSSSWSYDF
ncbi:hypothetical protein BV898_03805 [Hypsibius exemplaris]|uniref:Uncharacterized protein n=1 Tax=Hypsibius exemplaris TaxID=2072580 RepID=A0A1W0X466_HYPEX|nr:hypothetical protein BV898_03805 [Hypsibius exemplaris]